MKILHVYTTAYQNESIGMKDSDWEWRQLELNEFAVYTLQLLDKGKLQIAEQLINAWTTSKTTYTSKGQRHPMLADGVWRFVHASSVVTVAAWHCKRVWSPAVVHLGGARPPLIKSRLPLGGS